MRTKLDIYCPQDLEQAVCHSICLEYLLDPAEADGAAAVNTVQTCVGEPPKCSSLPNYGEYTNTRQYAVPTWQVDQWSTQQLSESLPSVARKRTPSDRRRDLRRSVCFIKNKAKQALP